jgi:arabinose-5-phosphate isomerase
MLTGDAIPIVPEDTALKDVILEMTARRQGHPGGAGVTGVVDAGGRLTGVITDGDLRRNIERGLDHNAGEFMTRDPKTVGPDDLIDDALTLFDEFKITALFVVKDDGQGKKPVGVLHIHDCPTGR